MMDNLTTIISRIDERLAPPPPEPTPLQTFTCHACGIAWKQQSAQPPALCPRCSSTTWNVERESRRCERCGHSWRVLPGHPHGKCPSCHSRLWDTPPRRVDNPQPDTP